MTDIKIREKSQYPRCYENHPPLVIPAPSGPVTIYGGSCGSPMVLNADVYVGFEMGMHPEPARYPWEDYKDVFQFYIQDRGVPKSVADFRKLLDYLSVQLIAQKVVHIGCIGGHGRTGLVLAALYAHMTGDKDAIKVVREKYCKHAVESQVQVNFLIDNFGLNHFPPSDKIKHEEWARSGSGGVTSARAEQARFQNPHPSSKRGAPTTMPKGTIVVNPVKALTTMWGSRVTFGEQVNVIQ